MHGNIGITSEAVALNVKPSTMQTYRTLFKSQIVPHLGTAKVQGLTPATLDKWLRDLQKAGLSRNTISATYTLIHHALNYAVYPAQCGQADDNHTRTVCRLADEIPVQDAALYPVVAPVSYGNAAG